MMDFLQWNGWFAGQDCLVVAPGPSSLFDCWAGYYDHRWVIGCNRAVQYCDADMALCVEPFRDPIWKIMRACPAMVVFSHLCQDRRGNQPHPRIVQFPSRNVAEWLDPGGCEDKDLWLAMSPFWAVAVAVYLGFEQIGIIGVDLTVDRYPEVWRENDKWARLISLIGERAEVINLSPISRLSAIDKADPGEIRIKGLRENKE